MPAVPPETGSGMEVGDRCIVEDGLDEYDAGFKCSRLIPLLYFDSVFLENSSSDFSRITVTEGRLTEKEAFNCLNIVCG